MPRGRPKVEHANFTQENVSELAAEALRRMRSVVVRLPLRFTFETPLLVQQWTTKAVRNMLGKMVGMPQPKENKDLTGDFENSWYRNEKNDPVIPCRVVKACVVEGAIATNGVVTKADLKRSLRVLGLTAPLMFNGRIAKPEMDVRIVRNDSGGPDVRARALFPIGTYFECVLEFGLPLTPDKVIAAVEAAGARIGLCEWRFERGGDLGGFDVRVLPSDRKTIDAIAAMNRLREAAFVIPPEMLRAFSMTPQEKLTGGQRKVKALAEHLASQEAPLSPPPTLPKRRGRPPKVATANGSPS